MNRIAWLVFAIVGAACSLSYQMILAKILAKLSGDVMVWESLSTGVFLLFMGIGSFRFAKRNAPASPRDLLRVEVALSLIGMMAPLLIYLLHIPYRIYVFDSGLLGDVSLVSSAFKFAACNLIFPAMVGYVSGFELPLLIQLGGREGLREKTMLAAYYAGALLGTLLFVWWLHPAVDTMIAGGLVALFNLALIVALSFALRNELNLRQFAGPMLLVSLGFYALVNVHLPARDLWSANFFYNHMQFSYKPQAGTDLNWPTPLAELSDFVAEKPSVESYRSLYREINVVPDADDREHFSVHLDGRFQFSSRRAKEYHEYFVHVPAMVFGSTLKKVLVLGGGDGLAVKELLAYGDVAITLVDLDRQVVNLAKTHPGIRRLNSNSLQDPRVEVVIEDALTFLMHRRSEFDAIYVDFTYPFDFDSARLFSAEFFALVRSQLKPGGFAVAISPVDFKVEPVFGDMRDIDHRKHMIADTLGTAGFSSFLAFNCDQGEFLAMGRDAEPRMGQAIVELPLEYVKASYFDSQRWQVFPTSRGELANRLLRPTFRGVTDTFF